MREGVTYQFKMNIKLEQLIEKGYITRDWAYGAEKAFLYFYDTIVPILRAHTGLTYPEDTTKFFEALKLCPFNTTKVVILGQDPYHDGSAIGIAFDAKISKKIPPSLRNILAEIKSDTGESPDNKNTYLEHLPPQGVLLINTAFSVKAGTPASHAEIWKPFTELLLEAIITKPNIIWVLWGKHAQSFIPQITNPTHKIIKGGHPSPLSVRAFKGKKYFSAVNNILSDLNLETINWGSIKINQQENTDQD